MNVVEWKKTYYPDIKNCSKEQKEFFKYFCREINASKYVDIDANYNYIFCYLYKITHTYTKTRNLKLYISKMNFIDKMYGNEYLKIRNYIYYWISDAALLENDYDLAFEFFKKGEWDLLDYLNIRKFKRTSVITANEFMKLINVKPYLTSFGQCNLDKLKDALEFCLNKFKNENKCNILSYWLEKYNISRKPKEARIFSGISNINLHVKKHYHYVNSNGLINLFKKELNNFIKEVENVYREMNKLPKVGESWLSETLLYYQLKEILTDYKVIQHATPTFLGKQHLDVYIPNLKLAIEYQGEQHQRPVEIFGGIEGFKKTKERDIRKKKLCEKNGVNLIYVYPNYNLKNLINRINSKIKVNETQLQSLVSISFDLLNNKKLPKSSTKKLNYLELPFAPEENEQKYKLLINKNIKNSISETVVDLKNIFKTSDDCLDKIYFGFQYIQTLYSISYNSNYYAKEFINFIDTYIEQFPIWISKAKIPKEVHQKSNRPLIDQIIKEISVGKFMNFKMAADYWFLQRIYETKIKILTNINHFNSAIEITDKAIELGLLGTGKTGFLGRKKTLTSKLEKQLSQLQKTK